MKGIEGVLIVVAMWFIEPMIKLLISASNNDHAKPFIAISLCFSFVQLTSWLGFSSSDRSCACRICFFGILGVAEAWKQTISGFADFLLRPVFFAYSGLQVSLIFSDDLSIWAWLCILVIVGCFGKIFGSYVASRLIGLDKATSLEMGVLMNTKGLVELVVLGVGLQTGILSGAAYSVLLLLALISTALTVPLISLINGTVPKPDNQYRGIGRTSV